jgi:FtsP/CotA-like multicopper oxidase with cupredoxin domain
MQKTYLSKVLKLSLLIVGMQAVHSAELQSPPSESSKTSVVKLSVHMTRCGDDREASSESCRTVIQGISGSSASVRGLYRYSVEKQSSPVHYAAMPKTLRLNQGQTLQFSLNNNVPCPPPGRESEAHVNIHTHGLLVAPREAGTASGSSFGDYSGVTITRSGCAQGDNAHGLHDPMAHRINRAQYDIKIPTDHPSGLYWYHPHIHGVAGLQIGGGASGLIEIGEFFDYAYFRCSLKEHPGSGKRKCDTEAEKIKERAKQKNTDQVLIALKDHQLRKNDSIPNEWTFPAAGYVNKFDPKLCNRTTTVGAWPNAQCSNDTNTATWAFTLNNQVFPTITIPVKSGGASGKVLRIANVSPNVTHNLNMRVTLADGTSANLRYQLLARDGMSVNQSTSSLAKVATTVHMMPASRAEIYVSHDDVCQAMGKEAGCAHGHIEGVLETLGFDTGTGKRKQEGDTNEPADIWPAIELAKLVFPANSPSAASKAAATNSSNAMQVITNRFERAEDPSWSVAPPAAARAKSSPKTGAASSLVANQDTACDGNPSATPPAVLSNGQFRLIGFKVFEEGRTDTFRLSAAVHNSGDDMLKMMPKEADYKAFEPSNKTPSVCVGTPLAQGGVKETWVIVNESKELHNFHIHQLKFKVEAVLDGGNSAERAVSTMPGGYHDTFPINPKGRIKISIRFDRQEQIGRYFFHCHILEHEDNGMMARVQVIDTSVRALAARRSGAAQVLARSVPHSAKISDQTSTTKQLSNSGLMTVSTSPSLAMRLVSRSSIPTIRDSQGREIQQDICATP